MHIFSQTRVFQLVLLIRPLDQSLGLAVRVVGALALAVVFGGGLSICDDLLHRIYGEPERQGGFYCGKPPYSEKLPGRNDGLAHLACASGKVFHTGGRGGGRQVNIFNGVHGFGNSVIWILVVSVSVSKVSELVLLF